MQQEQQKRNSNDKGKISGKIVRAGGSLAVIICLLWCGVWEVVPIAKSDTTPSQSSCSVVLGFIILCVVMVVDADTSPSQCKQENNILISACKPVFMGQKASAYCCQRFRIMHFECVCPLVTPKLTNLINVQHTIQQIRACGKRVPHNFKYHHFIEDSGRFYQNQYI
ncbi:hypothetical protein ACFX2H_041291 [Malus domestica]